MINTFYPKFGDWYGFLTGPGFNVLFAVGGIFAGVISDNVNRKVFATIMCMLWSVTTLLTGLVDSFTGLIIFRILLGIFESAYNPCAYGIITDYFHPSIRTTANSIYNGAIYLGGALASLSAALIALIGWRLTYDIIGIIGIVCGFVGFVFVKEPVRGGFDKKPEAKKVAERQELVEKHNAASAPPADTRTTLEKFCAAMLEIFINPTCRWIVVAGCCRYWAGFAIGYFMPAFMGDKYPTFYATYYSILNAAVVSVCGFCSAVGGGLISDRFEKKGNYMSKAWVCIIGTGLGIPTICLCTLVQTNFWVSMFGLALEYLAAECWIGPAITMILNTISPKNKGFAVGAFLFFASMFGMFSTLTLGAIKTNYQKALPDNKGSVPYGEILAIFVCGGYGLSIPFFYMAGRGYTAYKVKELREKEQAELDEANDI